MSFDEKSWEFPKHRLLGDRLFLCTRQTGILRERKVFGARLECRELLLPDINFGYEEERPEVPHIHLDLKFAPYDQQSLCGKRFERDALEPDESEESVYLFGAHNPVDTLWVSFDAGAAGSLVAAVHLRLNFDYECRIGGIFEHTFTAPVSLEDRP